MLLLGSPMVVVLRNLSYPAVVVAESLDEVQPTVKRSRA